MSWWTFVDFAYIDSEDSDSTDEFDVVRMRTEIEVLVSAQKLHSAVAQGICDLVTKRKADFRFNSYAVIELFTELAIKFPKVSFAIRGRGEDIRDVWVREYSQGRCTFALGPPEGAGI